MASMVIEPKPAKKIIADDLQSKILRLYNQIRINIFSLTYTSWKFSLAKLYPSSVYCNPNR